MATRVDSSLGKRKRSAKLTVKFGRRNCPPTGEILKVGTLKLVFRHQLGSREAILVDDVLKCAYDERLTMRALASKYSISLSSVPRCATSAACAYMDGQLQILRRMLLTFRVHRPVFFIRHLSWDEIGEKLCFQGIR